MGCTAWLIETVLRYDVLVDKSAGPATHPNVFSIVDRFGDFDYRLPEHGIVARLVVGRGGGK